MDKRKLLCAAATLTAAWLYVRHRAAQAEAELPASGRFMEVDGVRLHYIDRGAGPVVVLLHGNGALAQDFELSGLIDQLAPHFRVIAFDRPGFGYSERPRDRFWTADNQAALLLTALRRLNVASALLVGHSWGTLVALAMGQQAPGTVRGLVLLSGYYYPSFRPDAMVASGPAMPLLGDLMRFTLSPLLSRLLWPLQVRRMFSPSATAGRFRRLPKWLMMRPGQLRAAAAESGLMGVEAFRQQRHYGRLTMPITLMAGDGDQMNIPGSHSVRLHKELLQSELVLVPDAGHMLQYVASDEIVAAVRRMAALLPGLTYPRSSPQNAGHLI